MTTSWPGDSHAVVAWVRDAMTHMITDGELTISGLDRVKVSADLDGTDLRHLTFDATGVTVRPQIDTAPEPAERPTEESAEPQPVTIHDGVAKEVRVIARPIRIEKTQVNIDVHLHDVPIRWLTFAEPTVPAMSWSKNLLMPADDVEGLRGRFQVSMRTRDLAPLFVSVLRPALREGGVHLGRTRLDVTPDGADAIRITAYAGLRWKALLASARATARIGVTRDGVITIRDLTVGSRNLLVTFALLFARRHIREIVGTTIDINSQLAKDGVAVRIDDARVVADTRLTVSARFS